jgi:hypothetical protein
MRSYAGAADCAAADGAWSTAVRSARAGAVPTVPDHECDERCVPHRCKGASASGIHQIHAILHRAFAIAVK